jgi:hypothetical protein
VTERPRSPLNFTTNAGDECAAYIRLDDPTIKLTDNCSAGIELKADIYPNKDTNGAPIGTFYLDLNDGDAEVAGPIPAGTHTLRYTSTRTTVVTATSPTLRLR